MKRISIASKISSYSFQLTPYLRFSIIRDGKGWLMGETGMAFSPVRIMGGKPIQHRYSTLTAARKALQAVFDAYTSPLSRQEIEQYFNEAWLREEEDVRDLRKLRRCLLKGDYDQAAVVFDALQNWTKEAIPEKVVFHLQYRDVSS